MNIFKGGVLLTIYGENLKSNQIDLGGTQDATETGEGENYDIWLEKDNMRISCRVDRMLTLHARPLSGQDFVVCETAEVPIWGDWDVKMTIDDGLVSRNSNAEITLTEGYFFLIIQAQLCLNQFKFFLSKISSFLYVLV